MPIGSANASLRLLDTSRLNAQRREARQLLTAIETGNGWANHPAARMWRGYETALAAYANEATSVWVGRGYKNGYEPLPVDILKLEIPWWWSWPPFNESHKRALLVKMPEHYEKVFGRTAPDRYRYVWPLGAGHEGEYEHGEWKIVG